MEQLEKWEQLEWLEQLEQLQQLEYLEQLEQLEQHEKLEQLEQLDCIEQMEKIKQPQKLEQVRARGVEGVGVAGVALASESRSRWKITANDTSFNIILNPFVCRFMFNCSVSLHIFFKNKCFILSRRIVGQLNIDDQLQSEDECAECRGCCCRGSMHCTWRLVCK